MGYFVRKIENRNNINQTFRLLATTTDLYSVIHQHLWDLKSSNFFCKSIPLNVLIRRINKAHALTMWHTDRGAPIFSTLLSIQNPYMTHNHYHLFFEYLFSVCLNRIFHWNTASSYHMIVVHEKSKLTNGCLRMRASSSMSGNDWLNTNVLG